MISAAHHVTPNVIQTWAQKFDYIVKNGKCVNGKFTLKNGKFNLHAHVCTKFTHSALLVTCMVRCRDNIVSCYV